MNNLIPIDFNSLSRAENGRVDLSDYYIDYAFGNEGAEPAEGMEITFYDRGWMPNSDAIICFDATMRRNTEIPTPWSAELKGRIYTSLEKPARKYFSPFVGSNTRRLAEDGSPTAEQKVGGDPAKNKLANVACFMFPKGSALPNFSSVVGMDVGAFHDFFQFSGYTKPQPVNGKLPGDTLIVRGGSNKVESNGTPP